MKEAEIILFEKYLAGTLSPEERKNFEQRLKTDAAFKEDFELFGKMDNFLLVRDTKKERLAQLNAIAVQHFPNNMISDETKKKAPQASRIPIWFKRVAATVLLVVSFYFLFQLFAKPTYEKYAVHQTLTSTTQGNNPFVLSLFEKYFNTKKYQEALDLFDKLPLEEKSLEITIAKAICLLELRQTADAVAILQPIAQDNSARKNDALWYLGLAAVQSKDWEKVKFYLEQIPKGAFRYKKARELLGRI